MTNYQNSKLYKLVNDIDDDIYVGGTAKKYLNSRLSSHICESRKEQNLNRKVYKHIQQIGGWNHVQIVLLEEYPCNNRVELRARERHWIETLKASLNSEIPGRDIVEYRKHYRANNKEKLKKDNAEYYQRTKHTRKEYRYKNKDKINTQRKERYNKNKDEINARRRKGTKSKQEIIEFKKNNPELVKKRKREADIRYVKNNRDKINAKKRESRKTQTKILCECGKEITKDNHKRHLKTKYHINHI